jgi:hypothetical protein
MKKGQMPWSGNGHPFQIGVQYNDQMKRYDLMIIMGNFESKEDAHEVAGKIGDFITLTFGGKCEGVQ